MQAYCFVMGVSYSCLLESLFIRRNWVLSYLAVVILTALVYSSRYFSSVYACEIANEILKWT